MRADRLLIILSLLQAHGQLSSRALAVQLEVSERTIHRDMEALSIAGIPVYAERGSRGGWALSEGYRSQLTGMTIDEIRGLLLLHSSSVVRDLGLSNQVQSAFSKLLSALPSAVQKDAVYVRQRIHVDGAGWHRSAAQSSGSYLPVVQEAVWEERKLRIKYRGWDSEIDKTRIICPLGLVAKQSIWYLVAQAEDSESMESTESMESSLSIRTYRISRLLEATMLEDGFVRPSEFDLSEYWEQSTAQFKSNLPRYPARVRIASASWSKFAQERYVTVPTNRDLIDHEGRIEADIEFNTLESAVEILLSYGRHAQAISPQELRLAIYTESQTITSLYENN